MGQPAEKRVETPWLTTREAAEYCKMSKSAFQKHIDAGNIRPDSRARPGLRVHRFRRDTLDRWLEGWTRGANDNGEG